MQNGLSSREPMSKTFTRPSFIDRFRNGLRCYWPGCERDRARVRDSGICSWDVWDIFPADEHNRLWQSGRSSMIWVVTVNIWCLVDHHRSLPMIRRGCVSRMKWVILNSVSVWSQKRLEIFIFFAIGAIQSAKTFTLDLRPSIAEKFGSVKLALIWMDVEKSMMIRSCQYPFMRYRSAAT